MPILNRFPFLKKMQWPIWGTLLLALLAACLLLFNNANSNQSIDATAAQVRFAGQYRIGDGDWQPIVEGRHIPSTQGDVTLRGNFPLYSPDGKYIGVFGGDVPIAFYTDHIGLTFFEGEGRYVIDHEHPQLGASACGVDWTAHSFTGDGSSPIDIIVHNPHRFGNETAIDELLASVAIWGNLDFEKDVLESGESQRNTGLFFIIISFVLLGSALFTALLRIKNNRIIWLLGCTILSAGLYLAYSAPGVSFWSEHVSHNTTVLGISMMFYMLFGAAIITSFLKTTKKIGVAVTVLLGAVDGIYFLLPVFTDLYFYDTWLPWVITQSVANAALLFCLVKNFHSADKKERVASVEMTALLLAFEADMVATACAWWEGGFLSKYVFFALFVAALFVVLRLIPESIHAAAKAKELEFHRSRLEAEKNIVEAQLKDSRISIMLSQIQPHFIYNTLGTIERMCLKDPQKAFELVRNFSLYLRGNFSELDSVTPIRFAEELKHVEYYVNIEKVRFPDMTIIYNVEATDFRLPALSVQPLVENAIKHGLMRL
ncbi:MAG: histidine kinase [Clostridia bacterium]|nr:histidine kinase [Clostridia bacterium]